VPGVFPFYGISARPPTAENADAAENVIASEAKQSPAFQERGLLSRGTRDFTPRNDKGDMVLLTAPKPEWVQLQASAS
jgi:hypothetical protein